MAPPKEDSIVFYPLNYLVYGGEFLSDSTWSDSITHTLHVKVGPMFPIRSSLKGKIYPGAIVNKKTLLSMDRQVNNIEKLPVIFSFPKSSVTYTPSYDGFISELTSYTSKNPKGFQNALLDSGRPFSTYNDIVLLNGYELTPYTNWLTVNNKQTKLKKTGIAYTFKTIDLQVIVDLPQKDQLLDRNQYQSELEADSLTYVNTLYVGKRVILTFMCDTTYEGARAIMSKVRNNESLSNEENRLLRTGEIGYFLQGYGAATLPSIDNEAIVKGIYSLIENTTAPGEPIEFSARSIKDLTLFTGEIKVDIVRK